jgi:hypothetical protein
MEKIVYIPKSENIEDFQKEKMIGNEKVTVIDWFKVEDAGFCFVVDDDEVDEAINDLKREGVKEFILFGING